MHHGDTKTPGQTENGVAPIFCFLASKTVFSWCLGVLVVVVFVEAVLFKTRCVRI